MSYGINDIESLSFREGVRKRINMYLGSNDIEGAYQAIKEIINNSTDEALAGYGKHITLTLDVNDNSISIEDEGRGVPFGIRDNGENVLVSIYTKSHTGGKFNNSAYKNASGLNGIGGSCVCLSALKFRVESRRDGKKATAEFYKGELQNYKEIKSNTKTTGTSIWFIPDKEVFSEGEITYSFDRIKNDLKNISYLYPDITFTAKCKCDDNIIEENYCSKNGIEDFIKDINTNPLHKHIISAQAADENDSLEIAFQWSKDKEQSYVFVNGLQVPEGGTPITGAKSAITKTFNSLVNEDFNGNRIREGLIYVINCKVANPSFANQTKSKINNGNLRTLASTAFSEAIKKMAIEYKSEFDIIVELMKKIAKADEAAERAREAILNYNKELKQKKGKILFSDKLNDAKKIGKDSILLVVEGESAGGNMVRGRQASKMDNIGILKLRGKCINPYTHNLEEVLANEEVKLLCQALGIFYGEPLDESKLRYGKIAICVDADDKQHCRKMLFC